jgi:tetratricopeptide (TPR) repeat protein
MPLDDRLEAFISTGRALNPVTGTNWEGVGVEPDIEAPLGQALEQAVELARRSAAEYREWRLAERTDALAEVREAVARASELADAGQLDEALAALRGPLADAIERELLGERVVNMLGYAALEADKVGRGVTLLRFNAEAFPESANAHDSLGAAWRRHGDTAQALTCYRRALELDPDLESARRAVDELAKPGR